MAMLSPPWNLTNEFSLYNAIHLKQSIPFHYSDCTVYQTRWKKSISIQGLNIFFNILSGFLTIGLCTVPRKGASYLSLTLSRMIGGMKTRDKKDVVIVIFLASDDNLWLEETIKNIQFTYHDEIDSGLILVVQPKQHIYPDFR